MLIDLETHTPNFIAMVEKEINRIKGGNRYVWNECGEYTKLLLPEATILAYRFVGHVISLDPAHALEYLNAYPEALAKMTGNQKVLSEAIVGTVEDVIADRLAASPEVKKVVLAQWDHVTLDELAVFANDYATKLKQDSSPAGILDAYSVDSLKGITDISQLFNMVADGDEYLWGDLERKGKEYQEFIELILAGEFDFHSLSAKRGDVAALA